MKKALANFIRGWLPREVTLNHEASANNNLKLFTRRMATAIVTGAIATALLAVLGSLLNFGDIGRLVWLFAVVMLINAGIAAYGRYLRLKLGLPAEKNRGSGCPSNRT